jgi:hypothetical protein
MARFEDDDSQEEEDDIIPSEVRSWGEIAEYLPELSGPGFHITDRALDCADGSGRYPHPNAMWRALKALEKVGRAYNEMGAELDMRFEQFARQLGGIEVALQDNDYCDCWFQYEGKPYQRLPHVKVDDAKAPNEVGRIYFALDRRRSALSWTGSAPSRTDHTPDARPSPSPPERSLSAGGWSSASPGSGRSPRLPSTLRPRARSPAPQGARRWSGCRRCRQVRGGDSGRGGALRWD